ncbi:hypothetical protein B0H10DRAFT_2215199 [Mycena sp. CBHHK59/15]|nr:hypothetical protein B0H10DRAFT_2215199 [Mycena sp. CBHHK59/15]
MPLRHVLQPMQPPMQSSPFAFSGRNLVQTPQPIRHGPLMPVTNNYQPQYPNFEQRSSSPPRADTDLNHFNAMISRMSSDEIAQLLEVSDMSGGQGPEENGGTGMSTAPSSCISGDYLYDGSYSNDGNRREGEDDDDENDEEHPWNASPPPEDPNDEENPHDNAKSSLEESYFVNYPHLKKRKRVVPQQAPNRGVSDSDQEQDVPARQRQGKTTDAPEDHQAIVRAAYGFIQKEVIIGTPWPTGSPTGDPELNNDDFECMIDNVWIDGCASLGLDADDLADMTMQERNLVRSRISQVRGSFSKITELLVPANFSFTDVQSLADPTDETIEKTREENRHIVDDIKDTYYYKDPFHKVNDMLPDTMFCNAIFQKMLNMICFGKGANCRSHYFTSLDKLPLVTLALLMAAVVNTIDGWKPGQPEKTEFSAMQDEDLLATIQKELLRKARETSKTPIVEKEQRTHAKFSVSAFAVNQPRPVAST